MVVKMSMLVFNLEDGGSMFLRNLGICLRVYTASHSRRTISSSSPPLDSQIPYKVIGLFFSHELKISNVLICKNVFLDFVHSHRQTSSNVLDLVKNCVMSQTEEKCDIFKLDTAPPPPPPPKKNGHIVRESLNRK
jgi:hypothetical protein